MTKSTLLQLTFAVTALTLLASGCRQQPKDYDYGRGGGGPDIIIPEEIGGGDEFDWEIGSMSGGSFENRERVDVGQVTPIYFSYDAFAVPSGEYAKFGPVVQVMNDNPFLVLVIEGHCDERGTNEYNISLGEYRAQAVRNQLISMGISAARIQTSSYGEERPAAPGHNESAWSRNRRAEFAFYR